MLLTVEMTDTGYHLGDLRIWPHRGSRELYAARLPAGGQARGLVVYVPGGCDTPPRPAP